MGGEIKTARLLRFGSFLSAPEIFQYISHLRTFICSDVLQHPRLSAARLCGQSNRRPREQRGALGLRSRIQADWEKHGHVQEDRIWLSDLGYVRAGVPRYHITLKLKRK